MVYNFSKSVVGILRQLNKKNIFITTGLPELVLLSEKNAVSILEKKLLDRKDFLLIEEILPYIKSFVNYVVLVDVVMLLKAYKSLKGNKKERILDAVRLSKISFLGTDGIRGKVSITSDKYLEDFVKKNILSASLVENIVYVFCKILLNNKILKRGDYVCVGDDGRDVTTSGRLKKSVFQGVLRNNLKLYDLGSTPTPYVPYFSLINDIKASIVLTASHNPSNQNGVKFFVNSKKVLPEEIYGDYSISALLYKEYLTNIKNKDLKKVRKEEIKKVEVVPLALEFLERAFKKILGGKNFVDGVRKLKKDIIVLDTANGSYTDIAKKFFDKLSLNYVCVNEIPNGYNINKNCGVAEVEGHRSFCNEEKKYNKLVEKIFSVSENYKDKKVYGIVLDGDGDRGMLLVYHRKRHKLYVLDGDKCGYLLALHFAKFAKNERIKNKYFVSTVESDLVLSYFVSKNLDLKPAVVSVGDKWICNFEKDFVVGVESSGHLILPIKLEQDKWLFTGNGLLTALSTLFVVKILNLSDEETVEPYPEIGVSKTLYTYFVDKTLFYRGSEVWNKDRFLVCHNFKILKQKLPKFKNISLVEEKKEDNNMLYFSFKQSGKVIGCIFVRNSGTEDKIATYCKSVRELAKDLEAIAYLLNNNHINMMKVKDRIENVVEKSIMDYLNKNKEVELKNLKNILSKGTLKQLSEADLHNIVYAMKKEGLVVISEDKMYRIIK